MAVFGSFSSLKSELVKLITDSNDFQYIEDALKKGSDVNQRIKSLQIGEYSSLRLSSGTSIIEQHYMTKTKEDSLYESHKKFIDVQVIIEGDETILVHNINNLVAKSDYDEENDYILYEPSLEFSKLMLTSSHVAIFTPEDGHMPGISITSQAKEVYKTVLKIPV
jgi:beta-galactosidase beta subunit